MVKLFAIKCSVDEYVGFVSDETSVKHQGFNVKYITEEHIHEPNSGVVLFFSRGKATAVCKKIIDLAHDHKPNHKAIIEVVCETFDQCIANELLAKNWMFAEDKPDE